MDMLAIAGSVPVIPVLTIERLADAVPLARALVRGGLPVLEITLRTESALDALKAIATEVPDAVVGAGTVLTSDQLDRAKASGAQFADSPGCTAGLAAAAVAAKLPFLPGVQTISEAMTLVAQGFRFLKFFPAGAAGGLDWLRSAAAPLAGVRFCPTGGIGADNAVAFLALSNVVCVGGSWVAPRISVAAGDWAEVERLAAAAARVKRP